MLVLLMVIVLRALVLLQMVHLARVAFGIGRRDDRRLRGGGVHLGSPTHETEQAKKNEM